MSTEFFKEDDYTLSATTDLPSGGSLTRFFNFAGEQVTTIYERQAEKEDRYNTYGSGAGTSVSVALSSQMTQQKFSEFDSQREIELMRAQLTKLGGTPPEASDTLGKTRVQHPAVASVPATKN